MKYFSLSLIFLFLIAFSGCEKKLDVVPSSQTTEDLALSTVDGMDGALSFAYQLMHQYIGRPSILWSEALADHFYYSGTIQNFSNFYNRNLVAVVEERVSATDQRVVAMVSLSNLYKAINTASLIIRAIDLGYANGDVAFPANKDRLLGESYFIRAALRFDILRFYAKAWGASAGNAHPGIVVNLEAVDDRVSQVKARSTVAEVYDYIIADLQQAAALLPDDYNGALHPAAYYGRTYKDGARAYLARVYFQQQDYARAKEQINLILGVTAGTLSRHPLESGDITRLYKTRGPADTNPEILLQTTSALNISGLSRYWNSATESIYGLSPSLASSARATISFIQDAHFYSSDLRYTQLFRQGTEGLIPNKYSFSADFNQPLIRSAEMVLDRAEINAMDGNLPDALSDCNLIRSRASIPLLSESIIQTALLDSIRVERIRELCFEGDRLWNLKRMMQVIPPGQRTGISPLPWNGNELVFKFSSEEISKNPLLENNY